MSIHEATLYADLVRYLLDTCAAQLAELRATPVDAEREELDALIHAWFFTPQDELHGYTPQRIIRNEELGIRNTIPAANMGDLFFDDCPVCQMMREDAEAEIAEGHDHGWAFSLAPDRTLLDEYDPEGWDERWRIENERMEADFARRKAEAKELPFVGADDPSIAEALAYQRRLLEDDNPF